MVATDQMPALSLAAAAVVVIANKVVGLQGLGLRVDEVCVTADALQVRVVRPRRQEVLECAARALCAQPGGLIEVKHRFCRLNRSRSICGRR